MWNTLACVRQLDDKIFPHLFSRLSKAWSFSVSSQDEGYSPLPFLSSTEFRVAQENYDPQLNGGLENKSCKNKRHQEEKNRAKRSQLSSDAHKYTQTGSWACHWDICVSGSKRSQWGLKFWQEYITIHKIRMWKWMPYYLKKFRTSPDRIPSSSCKTLISHPCWKRGTVGCSQPNFLECVRNNFMTHYTF